MQVTLAPFRSGRAGAVVLGASVSGAALQGDERTADLAYRVINTDGNVVLERSGDRPIAPVAQSATSPGSMLRFAFHFSDRFEVPRGRYEIRFGAQVGDTAIGTVVAYVEVPDFGNRPLALSGLLVGPRQPGEAGEVPLSVLAERTFRPADVLKVTGALYTRRNVPVDRVLLETTIRDDTGTVVLKRSFAATTFPAGDPTGRSPSTCRSLS